MSKIGEIVWRDLTVPNAAAVKEFYTKVVGWSADEHEMGDYADFNFRTSPSEDPIAGICHARGTNANIPPQWLMYVQVDDVETAAQRCIDAGGTIVDGPRKMGGSGFCVIKDPAGAVLALVS